MVSTSALLCGLTLALMGCAPPVAPGYEDADFSSMTGDEKSRYLYDCLRDKGWDVTLADDGGIQSEGDSSQNGAFAADSTACNAPIRAAAIPMSAWSQESWDELYQAKKSEADCLAALGYNVPPAPSRDLFIENTLAGNQWTPWVVVVGQTPAPGIDPLAACPQLDFVPRRG